MSLSVEEIEAQTLEAMRTATSEELELLEQYLEINRKIAVLSNDKSAIAELIKESMGDHVALTHNNQKVVEIVSTTSTKTDIASIRKFFPEVAAEYITTKDTTKFDVKRK